MRMYLQYMQTMVLVSQVRRTTSLNISSHDLQVSQDSAHRAETVPRPRVKDGDYKRLKIGDIRSAGSGAEVNQNGAYWESEVYDEKFRGLSKPANHILDCS